MQDKVLALRTYFNSYLGADKAHRASDRPTKRSSQRPEPRYATSRAWVRSVPNLGCTASRIWGVQRPEPRYAASRVWGVQRPESVVYSVPSLGTQHLESGVLISNFSFILPVFVCCSRLSTDNHKRFLIAPAAVDDWLSDFIISA